MTFLFQYNTEEQHEELVNIIAIKTCSHFNYDREDFLKHKNGCYNQAELSFTSHFGDKVKIELANNVYFNDIEKAKEQFYKDLHANKTAFLKDWISDIQENLSFVPKIEVR